jgi:hypothetical protein
MSAVLHAIALAERIMAKIENRWPTRSAGQKLMVP